MTSHVTSWTLPAEVLAAATGGSVALSASGGAAINRRGNHANN